ncbi:MAG TPA: protein translocase subunit SecD [Gaiellaceae bacterium]|nr:protein translocase subunit SecD [Gaiellaceae bacterium]
MSERRGHLVLVSLIVAALVGVAALAIPGSPIHRSPTLGLDLQGGLEVVLRAVPEKGQKLQESDLDRSVEIMRNRVDKIGVSEPEIRKQGSDQIVIELPGVHDQARAAELIGKTAKLELYDLQADLTGPSRDLQGNPRPQLSLFALLSQVQNQAKKGEPAQFFLFDAKKNHVAGPAPTRKALLASRYVREHGKKGEVPKDHKVFAVPENTVVITCGKSERYCPGVREDRPSRTYFYLFKYEPSNKDHPIPEMTGEDLKLSGTRQDFDTQSGQPIVTMQFTGKGGDKFEDVTKELAERGRQLQGRYGGPAEQWFQQFAIVLDREIKSAPTIDFKENPVGIPPGNGAQITGIGSLSEAKDLALVLQTGALPVDYVTIERTDISATLGKDSLQQAKNAAIAGLIVVAIFLLLFYRFLGVVAVIGLGIYAAFLYAAVLLFNVTLTLPGFAGLILTIGVAADANVVVFERIKEEARAGKSVRAAIATGYAKGFHTILDANAVTAITALVLFLVATAGVKGFALMLLIGTGISLITAVAATRAMLGLLAGFSWFDNPRFMGAAAQQRAKWLQIDFIGRRRIWFAISGAVILISVVSLGIRGLNLGIDFKGGTQATFATPQAQSVDDVRSEARSIDSQFGKAVIQGRGAQTDGKYRDFQIRTESLSPEEQTKLQNGLEDRFQATKFGVKNVSESFGRQIARSAIIAILFSLFLIVLYLAIRFDVKYAGPVIAALLHDVVITVGIYSLTAREVTTSTVAAILTVLGYSIYDTIIIFDRIRENVPIMRRASFATIANVSLWETVRRSLATTFITLLPVGALLFFGGDTLKDFAFALLIGIGSGAYSSIFIAAPLLTMWKEREPEWARKKESREIDKDGAAVTPEEAEEAAAAEPVPVPELAPAAVGEVEGDGAAAPATASTSRAKRERRRQRRRARPHGRR